VFGPGAEGVRRFAGDQGESTRIRFMVTFRLEALAQVAGFGAGSAALIRSLWVWQHRRGKMRMTQHMMPALGFHRLSSSR